MPPDKRSKVTDMSGRRSFEISLVVEIIRKEKKRKLVYDCWDMVYGVNAPGMNIPKGDDLCL